MSKFLPVPNNSVRPTTIYCRCDPEMHNEIKQRAKQHGISAEEFVRQAVKFAIENLGKPS